MNICFFTENYYKGGLDTFFVNLFNAWPDEKDELNLVCNQTHPGLKTIRDKTIRPIKIEGYNRIFTSRIAQGQIFKNSKPIFILRALFVVTYRFLQYPILFLWYVFSLALYFRRSNYTRLMVVNGGYPASLLCRCAAIAWRFAGKRPLAVFNFHNLTSSPRWYNYIPEYYIDTLLIKSVSKIISVSKACLDTLSSRRAFFDCDKVSYIYNGINDPKLDLDTAMNETSKNINKEIYCLMLATYEPRKGHAHILKAFKNVIEDFPDVKLKMYGHGKPNEISQVLKEIEHLNLNGNVSLNGFITDTSCLIANSSVLVVPSQAYESFGLTIIEAMAFGIPIITTNVGGMPEVLGDCNAGYVCSKDDPMEFALAIKKILKEPSLGIKLGINGRKAFEERYTATRMAQKYWEILSNDA